MDAPTGRRRTLDAVETGRVGLEVNDGRTAVGIDIIEVALSTVCVDTGNVRTGQRDGLSRRGERMAKVPNRDGPFYSATFAAAPYVRRAYHSQKTITASVNGKAFRVLAARRHYRPATRRACRNYRTRRCRCFAKPCFSSVLSIFVIIDGAALFSIPIGRDT